MDILKRHLSKFIAITVVAISFIVLSGSFSFADVIYLKNGQVLEGIILSETDDEVVFKLSIGQVTLDREDIEGIEKSPAEDNEELKRLWQYVKEQKEGFQQIKKEITKQVEGDIQQQAQQQKAKQEAKSKKSKEKTPAQTQKPKISIKDRRIYVNDKLYYIKGVAYGINYPKCPGGMKGYRMIPFSVFEKDFKMMEEAGINTIRTYEPLPEELLDLALKHNIMVIENVVYPTSTTRYNSKKELTALKDEAKRNVEAHKNHPAILAWSIWNDAPFTWGPGGNVVKRYTFKKVNNFLKEIYLAVKSVDETHPITGSNMLGQEGTELGFDFLDIIGVNAYIGGHGRWLGEEEAEATIETLVEYSKKYNKPVVILETGYSTYIKTNVRKESQYEVISKQIKITGEKIAGITIFQWSDGWWKAGHPEVHNKHIEEHWGIVTGYRKPKSGLKAVSELFNSIPTESKGYKE